MIQELKTLLEGMQYDSKNLTFYKPKMASLGFTISTMARTLQIVLTPPLPDATTGFAKEGEKRYDHNNNVFSSFSSEDAFNILLNWDAILKGTYVSPGVNDEKYKNIFSLQRQDGKFIQIQGVKEYKTEKPTLRIAIRTNSGTLNYILRSGYELATFKTLLEHTFKNLIFYSEVIQGVVKQLKKPLGTMSGGTGPSQASSQSSRPPQQESSGDPNAGIFADMNSDGTTKESKVTTETPVGSIPPWEDPPGSDDTFASNGVDVSVESESVGEEAKSPDEISSMFDFD